jgi:hypothetical protein
MRSILFALAIVVGAQYSIGETTKNIDDLATHEQVAVIKIADEDKPLNINAFCLDAQGRIVAACGNGPGEVRIVNDDGKILRSWEIDVRPESINVADDGSILVGGEGKLFRFSSEGKTIQAVDSPHAVRLRNSKDELRKAAIAYLERRARPVQSRIAAYESMIEQLKQRAEKGELNEAEKRMLTDTLPNLLERYKAQAAEQEDEVADKGPSEQAIKNQMETLFRSKMRIASISSTGDHVFVATPAVEGYGYDVWKMNGKFADAEVIVTGLSGCCGQMDVQCCEQGIFVAENSRDRVVHFDFDGEQITNWGKSDRTGIDGFASCCNPMNVCFDSEGYVYTAESSVGRIKQFDANGKLIAYIGDVDLVPGCKNVSIAVSPVNDNIYMLDLTRNHIKMMQPKREGTTAKEPPQNQTTQNQPQTDDLSKIVASVLGALLGGSDE